MVAVLELPCEPRGVLVEVDVVDGRVGRKPGPFQHDQFEAVAQTPPLRLPRGAAAHDASVDEHETLHRGYPNGVTK